MAKTYDAVIIGAGILGPSTAYHLSEGGITDIAIIDSHTAGGQATRATAAMVMHQTGIQATTKLSQLSIKKYANFINEVGYDIGFKQIGSVLFTTSIQGENALKEQAAMQQSLGVLTETWDSDKLQRGTHNLINPEGILSAIYCSADGYIDANLAVNGYLSKAKQRGAEIIEDTQVAKVITRSGRVVAVETSDGETINAKLVINCAGSYANDIARSMGISIPIKASYKCLGVLSADGLSQDFPIVEDIDQGWYFRPHNKGVLVGFGQGQWIEDKDREAFPSFDTTKEAALHKYIAHRAPALAHAALLEKWAGYRPMIDPKFGDNLPIIGAVDGIEGYYNNCGYGEFGITHAAIGGELLASIILGKSTPLDTKPFLLSRFA